MEGVCRGETIHIAVTNVMAIVVCAIEKKNVAERGLTCMIQFCHLSTFCSVYMQLSYGHLLHITHTKGGLLSDG